MRNCCPTTFQILRPPGIGFRLSKYEVRIMLIEYDVLKRRKKLFIRIFRIYIEAKLRFLYASREK